ncbi:MAG: type pilus assembly protein PilQ [Candidatus Sumerlaeota bacterium]|nr:type pilus assembly protein PilQ [Candidatus Sumerlaeota bacterium]
MVSRTASPSTRLAAVLGAIALTSAAAWAGPTIDAWDLQQTQQQERIRLRWSEPGAVELHEFPSARQLVVKIPEAALGSAGIPDLDTSASSAIRNVRVTPVTLNDGRDGLQLTINLKSWQKPSVVSTPRWLTISLDAATAAPAVKASSAAKQQSRILLSNEDIEALLTGDFGSADAPDTGAGQSTAGAPNAFSSFYVPPDLTTEEKRAQATGIADLGMLATQDLLDRHVDIDFKDADLQNIIRSIAAKLKLNIIMTPGQVRGSVTVSLNNVRLGDALDALLKSNDLAYKIEQGGILRIVPRSEVRGSEKELETRAIAINWLDAGDVSAVIDPFLSADGTAEFSIQSNILIVQDVPENLGQIQELVYRLDVPEKQVRMEARLIDISESARRQLGFRWDITSQNTIATQNAVGGTAPESTASIGISNIQNAALDATINEDIGIFGENFDVAARIQALEERNEAVTLATPTILSLNNIPASIEIKRQIPYRDAVNTDTGSVATVKFSDVGTRVDVTPRITNNGHVTMVLETEQKILVGNDEATGVPIVDERFTSTSVTVKDDQTVVLGGLRQFEALSSEQGTPWLLRAPILGWLFKGSSNRQQKLDLFLFITPHILKDPEPTALEKAMYEKIDYNWDLPDFYFDEVRTRKSPGEINDSRVKVQDYSE